MPDKPQNDKKIGTYIFGSILLVFLICVFYFSPDKLPIFKQRLLAIFSSVLSGLFTYFFTGTIKGIGEFSNTMFGKITVQATSGIVVFLLVLLWWLSPFAPVQTDEKIEIQDIRAKVTFTIGCAYTANSTLPIPPEIFKNTSQLELQIADNDNLDTTKLKGWKNGFFISKTSLKITSAKQTFDRKTNQSVDGVAYDLIREYDNFTGQINGEENKIKWSNASFEAIIRVNEFDSWIDSLRTYKDLDFPITLEDFLKKYQMTETQYKILTETDSSITTYPITAKLEIFNKGVLIGQSEGYVVKVREWDEDVRQLFIVKFPIEKIKL
jgi:hypothetical protein